MRSLDNLCIDLILSRRMAETDVACCRILSSVIKPGLPVGRLHLEVCDAGFDKDNPDLPSMQCIEKTLNFTVSRVRVSCFVSFANY